MRQPDQHGRHTPERRVGHDAERPRRQTQVANVGTDDLDVARQATKRVGSTRMEFESDDARPGGSEPARDRTLASAQIEHEVTEADPARDDEFGGDVVSESVPRPFASAPRWRRPYPGHGAPWSWS